MAIIIAALGWQAWWYLVPTVLIAIITADLRVAGTAAREAILRAEEQLELRPAGRSGRNGVPGRTQEREEVARRVREAGRRYAQAEARWAELAPDVDPADVESLIEREQAAARQASSQAVPAPEEEEEGEEEAEPGAALEPADLLADLPDPGDDRGRVLAVRLAEEAAHTLAGIDRQLTDLARVEYARRSLEWHAAHREVG